MIHSTAIIEENAQIGEDTNIWHYVHVREFAIIGNCCVVGKDVYIDKHVIIGNRCKIQNGVSIYQGVTVEDDVFVGPNVTFTNDKYPRAFNNNWKIVPTIIRRGVGIGAGSVIVCGIEIGEYAMIGAGSVVVKDVEPYSLVCGSNTKFISWICKCGKRVLSQRDICDVCRNTSANCISE